MLSDKVYPTLSEVEQATPLMLGYWFRYLDVTDQTDEKRIILQKIIEQVYSMGGISPNLARDIDWVRNL